MTGKFGKLSVRSGKLFFAIGWMSLALAGITISGAILRLLAFPLAAISFAAFALFRITVSAQSHWAGTVAYWLGILFLIYGAFHFGGLVGNLNMISTHYVAKRYLPPRPNIPKELAIWCTPAVAVSVSLFFSRAKVEKTAFLSSLILLSLNPVILWFGTSLRIPLSL